MSSHHLVDPELAAGLPAFPPFTELTLDLVPTMRTMLRELARQQIEQTPLDGLEFFETNVPGQSGAPDVRVVVYRPAKVKGPLPAYLHVHGGGLIVGTPEMRHAGSVNLARNFTCMVASVDYRLAPEAPFPAAVEDCYAVLKWLHESAPSLGIDPARIVIGGESAGGGLTAALAILARDRGKYPVAFQMLTYPMLDDRTCVANANPHVGEFVWTNANNAIGWRAYLGLEPGSPGVPAHAAPARCENLVGLPPTFIATGSLDLFLEEDLDYAKGLLRAGVPTEMHIYPGAFHAFDLVVDAQLTKAFRRDWGSALERALKTR